MYFTVMWLIKNSINSLRVMGMLLFSDGASSQISANTHFHQHVSILCRKAGAQLRILQRLSSYMSTNTPE